MSEVKAPVLNFTSAQFDAFCKEKKLMGTRCKNCGTISMPPRPLCLKCHSYDMEWIPLSGKGKILSFTVISYGPWTMTNAGYGKDNPYCSGIIQLEEGPRMSTQIVGVDAKNPANIKIGTPVVADFMERGSFSLVPEVAAVKKTYLVLKAV